jgi:putative addiction module component (TIGR02574 family)
MSEAAEKIRAQIDLLPIEEREEIMLYLFQKWEPELTEHANDSDAAFVAELDRRNAEMESGLDPGVSWEEVRAELDKDFP